MTLQSLLELVEKTEAFGGSHLVLRVEKKRAPRNWDRCQVFPDLYGRCVGCSDVGTYVMDVETSAVRRYLKRFAK